MSSSPRKRQDFEHSFKRIKRVDPRREVEEERDWKRDLDEEIDLTDVREEKQEE